MSRDIESVLRDAVRDLASQARPAYGLAAAAVRRQRRIRLRRRVGGSLVAVVAAAAVATPYVVLWPSAPTALTPSPSASPSATPSRYPRSTGPTTLPEASGVPGAADRPDLVGSDPGVLHFDLDLSAFSGVSSSVWRSSLGVENIRFGFDDAQRDFEIFVTQREQHAMAVIGVPPVDGDLRQETTVRGRPAVLHRYRG